ncbi:MAG TPA: sarcosine oxidase subunit gamma family protein [Mycobacterium sp.]|nr:sarcosine oxidase subunit gamma family protein [Mycobacterium sp.]
MAETLTATSPLQGWSEKFAQVPPTVQLREEPFVAMVDLRADPDGAAASRASAILGLELPTAPSTYVSNDTLTAIWMGPDEWLIAAGTRSAAELEAQLRAAVAEHGGAAVDVSAQRTTLRLSGPDAREVLAKGCSLDLHPKVFTKGTAAQTMLGLAGVVLIALNDAGTDYGILVRSSFARYLADWLIDAAEEFGVLH